MSEKKKKKQSPVGCVIFLIIAVVAFIFLPWQVALGITAVAFFIALLMSVIGNEIGKIRQRNITQKTLISQAGSGFTELVAKVKPRDESLTTWLGDEPASYRWVSFQHFHRPKQRSENNPGHWVSFYDSESESKALTVTDGSGECSLLLHMADFRIKSKSKKMKPVELLQELKSNPVEGFDVTKIEKDKTVQVVETWIPKDDYVYIYGDMYVFDDEPPKELLQGIEKSWRGGDYRNEERVLSSDDWQALVKNSQSLGHSKTKVLATNYDQDPADGVIISQAGDGKVNLTSYFTIFAICIAIIFILAVTYFIIKSEYPEIIDQLLSFLN